MWIAQDFNGKIFTYEEKPTAINNITTPQWLFGRHSFLKYGQPNKDWQDSLINLETHDYKIVDGILTKIDKVSNKTPRPHAELACKYFMDDTVKIQYKKTLDCDPHWVDVDEPMFYKYIDYREKPKTETLFYRNYLKKDGSIGVCENRNTESNYDDVAKWLGPWEMVGDIGDTNE